MQRMQITDGNKRVTSRSIIISIVRERALQLDRAGEGLIQSDWATDISHVCLLCHHFWVLIFFLFHLKKMLVVKRGRCGERRPSAVCSRVGVGSTLSLRLEP